MALAEESRSGIFSQLMTRGTLVLLIACAATIFFFQEGFEALLEAWQLPEYSHGPLIPLLSGFLFLRQLKTVPEQPGAIRDRWVGVIVIMAAMLLAGLGKLSNIADIVAYALILWVGGMLLVSFGWRTGRQFWPGVLHLVYMLPLPGVLYYKMSTWLQFISSELGVWFLKLMSVPVFLDGNIIDLGVTKLHVAEACSGLRYLFPILSFSYIFACLYRGPVWHKAVLLISAAPITVLMNSVRIAMAGYIVNNWGLEWVEGFSHFFEGWVIFVSCIIILFFLAWLMMQLQRKKQTLAEALDLDTSGLGPQLMRLRHVRASGAMITGAALMVAGALSFAVLPERGTEQIDRDGFALFPRSFDTWQQAGPRQTLAKAVAKNLGADDYHQVDFVNLETRSSIGLFMAWYNDQSKGGVHSPEICLPGAGWEIAWLERTDISAQLGWDQPFRINRAIIQKGETRMMVYYWFKQKERNIAWDFAAKFWLMMDGISTGRTDGALVRLTTLITPDETDATAEARLFDMLKKVQPSLDRFIPSS